jgi:hypothetical protein
VSDCRAGSGSYQPDARRPCVITRPAQAVGTEHCPDAVKAPTRCQQQMHIMLQLLLVVSTKLLWSPAPLRGGSEHTELGRPGRTQYYFVPSEAIWDLIMPGLSARQRKRQSTILHTA